MKKVLALPALTLALALAACGPRTTPALPTPAPTAEAPAAAGVTLTPYTGLSMTEGNALSVLFRGDFLRLRVRLPDGTASLWYGGVDGTYLPPEGLSVARVAGASAEVWTGTTWQTVAAWR